MFYAPFSVSNFNKISLLVVTACTISIQNVHGNTHEYDLAYEFDIRGKNSGITIEEITHPFRGIHNKTPLDNCVVAYNYFENNIFRYCSEQNGQECYPTISHTQAFIEAQNYVSTRNPKIPLKVFKVLLDAVVKQRGCQSRYNLSCFGEFKGQIEKVGFIEFRYMNDDMVIGAFMIVGAVFASRIPGVGLYVGYKLFDEGYNKIVEGYNKLPK